MIMANNYPNSTLPGAAFQPPGSSFSAYSHDSGFVASDFFVFNEPWIEENPAFSSFPADYPSQSSNLTASEVVYNSNGIDNLTFYEEPSDEEIRKGPMCMQSHYRWQEICSNFVLFFYEKSTPQTTLAPPDFMKFLILPVEFYTKNFDALVINIVDSVHGGVFVLSGASDKEKKEAKEKVAFKTKSEVEILDDGFKWRKYGKKMVKNSPNPRNYYRCSVEGCPVKKRVERDKEDSRYVVTTYEGIHNHQGPQPRFQ